MMQKEFDIVVVGDIDADLVIQGNCKPEYNQVERLVDDVTLSLGGSSAIFACGAARLGLKVAFVGKVGDDLYGQYVTDALNMRGVNTDGMIVDKNYKTAMCFILACGFDRALLSYITATTRLSLAEVNLDWVKRGRHVHVGSYFLQHDLMPGIPELFKAAHQAGMTTSLDTNYDPTDCWDGGLADSLAQADVFMPNETELHGITGEGDTMTALEKLAQRVPVVGVKLGEKGGVARKGAEIYQANAISVKVMDTTGCGDNFDAGFIYGYLAGWDTGRCLRMGCVCGSLAARQAGGIDGQATLSEAMHYLS
jgi:sugar/nucleoside kinase (ribokinase family)